VIFFLFLRAVFWLDPSVSVPRALLGWFAWARSARSGAGRVDPPDSAIVWCGD
jgi:hypothetical protein